MKHYNSGEADLWKAYFQKIEIIQKKLMENKKIYIPKLYTKSLVLLHGLLYKSPYKEHFIETTKNTNNKGGGFKLLTHPKLSSTIVNTFNDSITVLKLMILLVLKLMILLVLKLMIIYKI